MSDDDPEPFFGACRENIDNLVGAFKQFPNTEMFMRDENLRIPLFPTQVDDCTEQLHFSYDLDGIVVQVSDLSMLRASLHYLFVGKLDSAKLQCHWHILKKHINLKRYTEQGVSALRKTVGAVLGFVDGGYFLNISCLPANGNSPHPMFKSDARVKSHALGLLNSFFQDFADRLKRCSPQDLERPTLMKNNLNRLSRLNIVGFDQTFIMEKFMESFLAVNNDVDMALLFTITKFGQKQEGTFNLAKLIHPDGVSCVSYHAGCTISCKDASVDLLWARYGLQEVVGQRGTLFSCYAMCEASNFQTNLDHLPLDLNYMLLGVFHPADKTCHINFVQLYGTTPHVHESSPSRHPVSRVITTCGLHNEKHQQKLMQSAKMFVEHVDDLTRKTVTRTCARIEAVFLTFPGFPQSVQPSDFYIQPDLDFLLESIPMVVPFRDNSDGLGLRHVVQSVAKYLNSQLFHLFSECKGMGGYRNSWLAFQLELAIEELFYGRPVCTASRRYSPSLGVSSTNPNSMTRLRGFLGLAPVGSASVGEDPPPLDIWFREEVQQLRVLRVFPLTDCLEASSDVIGEALTKVLLGDLYQRNDRLPLEDLRGPDRPIGNLVDCRSVTEFTKDLLERKGFGYPHSFQRAVQIVSSAGHDVHQCLELGLSQFKFFPKVTYWDESRHPKVKWNFKDFIELHKPTELPSMEARAASVRGDVCGKIEKLGLSFSRNLDKYRSQGMPWLPKCIERLPKGMPKDRLIEALAFISCVAMIQNGDYVSFEGIRALAKGLPVTQRQMQLLHIQSNLLLLHSPEVWRLHESIPYKVAPLPLKPHKPAPAAVPPPQPKPPEELEEVVDDIEQEVVERIDVMTVPASLTGRWSQLEISFIDLNPERSHGQAYKTYLQNCHDRSLSARTFSCFKRKRQRLMPEGL